jgi:hypothetical protein
MTEIRRSTSVAKLQREITELRKLAEKQGLVQPERPTIKGVFAGPKRDAILKFLGKRHSAVDSRGVTYFTLHVGTPGAVGMPANDPADEGGPPDAA